MKKIIFFLFCLVALLPFRLQADDCSNPQYASTMTMCSGQQALKQDKILNRIYNDVLKKYQKNKLALNQIKSAQKAWIKFRDAHLESVFPIEGSNNTDRMCRYEEEETLILQRIKQLKFLLNSPEYDVCGPRIDELPESL